MKRAASIAISAAILVIGGCAGLLGLDEGSPITDGTDETDGSIDPGDGGSTTVPFADGSTCPAETHACGSECLSNASVASCGTQCGACDAGEHAQAKCTGTCGVTCDDGFDKCAGNPESCETSITSGTHCGSCSTVCTSPTPFCSPKDGGGSECAISCTPPLTTCVTTHVCTNIDTDPLNCGGCGTVCASATPNAHAACKSKSCTEACDTNFHPCLGSTLACLEKTSTLGCGETSCTPCPVPVDGSPTCDGTACGISCMPGYLPVAGTCRAFGGAYQVLASAPLTCLVGNPLVAGSPSPCICPIGFTDVAIPNVAASDSSPSILHVCESSTLAANSDWGGISLHDDSRGGPLGCLVPNAFTGACGTCPNPTSVQFIKIFVYGGAGSLVLKAGTLTVCGPNLVGPGKSFLGAWEKFNSADVIVAGGDGCIAGNKQQGGSCACGMGQRSVGLQTYQQGVNTGNESIVEAASTTTFCFP